MRGNDAVRVAVVACLPVVVAKAGPASGAGGGCTISIQQQDRAQGMKQAYMSIESPLAKLKFCDCC